MTELTPGATPPPSTSVAETQPNLDYKQSKPSDSSVKNFEQLLEGHEDEDGGLELRRGPRSNVGQGGQRQESDKQFQQGLAGQKLADAKTPTFQQTVDSRQSSGLAGAANQTTSVASPPSGQVAEGLRSDAAISQSSVHSTVAGVAASQKSPSEGKKSPLDAGTIGNEVNLDEAISSLQQGTQAQSAAPTAAAVSLGGDARAEDVAKLANTFYKELGARDLNALKQGGALQFKLGGDAFPGTSVKVSVEAGLIVLDVSSIEPEVQQLLKDSQVELNRFFDAGVSVRVDERDEQSDQQQPQDEPEDQDENE